MCIAVNSSVHMCGRLACSKSQACNSSGQRLSCYAALLACCLFGSFMAQHCGRAPQCTTSSVACPRPDLYSPGQCPPLLPGATSTSCLSKVSVCVSRASPGMLLAWSMFVTGVAALLTKFVCTPCVRHFVERITFQWAHV